MTTVEYDELHDQFGYVCHEDGCPTPTGCLFDRERDANLDADRHDELHDDGVIR